MYFLMLGKHWYSHLRHKREVVYLVGDLDINFSLEKKPA